MTNTKGSGKGCPKASGRRWKRLASIPIDPKTLESLSHIGIFLVNPLMEMPAKAAKKTSAKAGGAKATTLTKCKRCNGGCAKGRKSR